MKNFIQPGEKLTLENVSGSAIVSGQVVKKEALIVIAEVDIPIAGKGSALAQGVVEVAKTTPLVLEQGVIVGFNDATQDAVVGGAGDYDIGHAWEKAESGDTKMLVKLLAK